MAEAPIEALHLAPPAEPLSAPLTEAPGLLAATTLALTEEPPQPEASAEPQAAPSGAEGGEVRDQLWVAIDALRQRQPVPMSVLFLDPGAPSPLSDLQAESVRKWGSGHVASYMPTTTALRRSNAAELAAGVVAAKREMNGEAMIARPDAYDPKGMASAWAALGFAALEPRRFAPRPPRFALKATQVPTVDAVALFAAHKASGVCADCDSGCYGGSICSLISSVEWPWGPEGPPPMLPSPPKAQKYDPAISALVRLRVQQGSLVPIKSTEGVRAFGRVFDAPRAFPTLSAEEVENMAAHGDAGASAALAAAEARVEAFQEAMETACRDGKSPRKAWEAGRKATLTTSKSRLVVDLGGWKKRTIHLKFRYASLEHLLSFLAELYSAGEQASALAADLLSGYIQLELSEEASMVTAIAVTMEKGGPPSYFVHGRVPQGANPSCGIFSLYTGLVLEIYVARATAASLRTCMRVYLDDFLGAMLRAHGAAAMALLYTLMDEVRATRNHDKSSAAPEEHKQMLGIVVTTSPPRVAQPAPGLVRIIMMALMLAKCAKEGTPVPASALEQLAGSVAWLASTDPIVASSTRALASCTSTGKRKVWTWEGARAHKVAADLAWLELAARKGFRGERLLACARDAPSLFLASDATADAGNGPDNGVALLTEVAALKWHLPDCGGLLVAVLEVLPIILFLIRAGKAVSGMNIVWAMDAYGAAFWVASRKVNSSDPGNDLMKLLCLLEEALDVRVTVKWVTRWMNYGADRGATESWERAAARGMRIPALREEVTLTGLPCDFLAAAAQRLQPGFTFATEEWAVVNKRGAPGAFLDE